MSGLSPTATSPTRVFLVGSPRSGTTLLQSLLASHPKLTSFPETHFFLIVTPRPEERWRRKLGIASSDAPEALERLAALGITENAASDDRRRLVTLRQYARLLTRTLDQAAATAGSTHWLEKTPNHLHYSHVIERYVSGARFVHMIRDGRAVIASNFEVRQKHPTWGGAVTLDVAIDKWHWSIRRSLACLGRQDHFFVSYERLVAAPRAVLSRLCGHLGLPVSDRQVDQMLNGYAGQQHRLGGYAERGPEGVITGEEPWKETVGGPIENRNDEKFMALFDSDQRALIERAVATEDQAITAIPFV